MELDAILDNLSDEEQIELLELLEEEENYRTWTEHQRTECCSFPRNTKSRITRKGSGQTDSQRKQSVKA